MADCFIVAIQPPLEENWNKEIEDSWRALFRLVIIFDDVITNVLPSTMFLNLFLPRGTLGQLYQYSVAPQIAKICLK